jgi:uncharacterized phage infection (PIP) family protein YhgE
MLAVGLTTFGRIASLQSTLEGERQSLVESIRTVSATLHDTSGATANFQRSIDRARSAADDASKLANNSAGTFRDLGLRLSAVQLFGIQPLVGLGPQFDSSANQLQQLAISLGNTRDALSQNSSDVSRVGGDLDRLQAQLEAIASTLSQPGALGFNSQSVLPFQIAFYGMCLLVILQSAFSIVAGIVLYRLQQALGIEPLFPHVRRATTSAVVERDRVQVS